MPGLSFVDEDGEMLPPPPLVGGHDPTNSENQSQEVSDFFPSPPLSSFEGAHPVSEDEDEDDDDDDDDDDHDDHYPPSGDHFLSTTTTSPTSSSSPLPAATTPRGGVVSPVRGLANLPRDSRSGNTSSMALFPYPITIVDPATDERLRRRNSGRHTRDRVVQVPKMVFAANESNGGNGGNGSGSSSSSAPAIPAVGGAEAGVPTSVQGYCSEHHYHYYYHYYLQHHHQHHPSPHYRDHAGLVHRNRSLRSRDRRRQGVQSWPLGPGESSSTRGVAGGEMAQERGEEREEEGVQVQVQVQEAGTGDHGTICDVSLSPSEVETQGDEGRRQGQARVCAACDDQPFGRPDHHHHHHHSRSCCDQELSNHVHNINPNTHNNNNINNDNTCMPNIDNALSADLAAPRPFLPCQASYLSLATPDATAAAAAAISAAAAATATATATATHMHNDSDMLRDINGRQVRRLLHRSESNQDGERAVPFSTGESSSPGEATFFLGDDIPVQPSWVIEEQQCRLQPPFINGRSIDQSGGGGGGGGQGGEQGSVLSPRTFHHHSSEGTDVHEPPPPSFPPSPPYVLSSSPHAFSSSLLLRSPYFPQPYAGWRPCSCFSPPSSSSTPTDL